jgi:hypothetical protein
MRGKLFVFREQLFRVDQISLLRIEVRVFFQLRQVANQWTGVHVAAILLPPIEPLCQSIVVLTAAKF